MKLRKAQEDHYRNTGDTANLSASLGNQAVILKNRGDLDGAMALHKEEERICRELGNKDGLQRTLGNQALILAARGDLDGAMALLKEQERICRELGQPMPMAISLINQANLLFGRMRKPEEALPLAKEALDIFRRLQSPNAKKTQQLLSDIEQALDRR